jgi:hypothetical protein
MAAVVFGEDAGLGGAEHDLTVEAFVAQRAVKSSQRATVLLAAAGFYIERLDLTLGQPLLEDAGDELAAVVAVDVSRSAARPPTVP